MLKIGTKYKSSNGQIGEVKNISGKPMLEVKNNLGKVTQKIKLDDINLTKFEVVS